MDIDKRTAGLCLCGFIRGESQHEIRQCLQSIERSYGREMARTVRKLMRNRTG